MHFEVCFYSVLCKCWLGNRRCIWPSVVTLRSFVLEDSTWHEVSGSRISNKTGRLIMEAVWLCMYVHLYHELRWRELTAEPHYGQVTYWNQTPEVSPDDDLRLEIKTLRMILWDFGFVTYFCRTCYHVACHLKKKVEMSPSVLFRFLHSTAGAMQGKTSYKSSLEARLNLFQPSRTAVDQFVTKHPPAFTPKVE